MGECGLNLLQGLLNKGRFYENQISAAKQILGHFENEHYVLLSAQMQSGKTGCALYCAFDMLISKKVASVFIISGSSETELRKQWALKFPTHLVEYCAMHNIHDNELIRKVGEIIASGIIWRQDLLKSKDKFTERFLIIWDESHFATTEEQTLHKFLESTGLLSAVQGDTSSLKDRNSYILSVTATRCAEHSRLCGANDGSPVKGWKTVVMNPGKSYRGVKQLVERNLVKCSFPIKEENQEKIEQIIQQYISLSKYMVIRCQQKDEAILQEIAVKFGINVIKYNMETSNMAIAKRSGQSIVDVTCLETCPPKFTLVLIRGMLRMGKELPKKHVCAVFEPGCTKHNTILQGLLGRVCGYYDDSLQDIHVYIPSADKNRALQEYIGVIDSGFTKSISRTIHIPQESTVSDRYTNVPFRIRTPKDSYSPFSDSKNNVKKNLTMFCRELLTIVDNEQHGFLKKDYTVEQLTEIKSFLQNPDPEAIMCGFTHMNNGKLKKSVNDNGQLADLSNALMTHTPISKYNTRKSGMINHPMVISRINGISGFNSVECKQFQDGDFIVTFNTQAKPDYALAKGINKANKSNVWHSKKSPGKTLEMETDGVTKSYFPQSVRTHPEMLKKSLREAIIRYLGQTHLQGGNVIGKQCLQKENYKNIKYVAEILKNIEKEFQGRIRISYSSSRGRPSIGEENCIRLKTISWTKI